MRGAKRRERRQPATRKTLELERFPVSRLKGASIRIAWEKAAAFRGASRRAENQHRRRRTPLPTPPHDPAQQPLAHPERPGAILATTTHHNRPHPKARTHAQQKPTHAQPLQSRKHRKPASRMSAQGELRPLCGDLTGSITGSREGPADCREWIDMLQHGRLQHGSLDRRYGVGLSVGGGARAVSISWRM